VQEGKGSALAVEREDALQARDEARRAREALARSRDEWAREREDLQREREVALATRDSATRLREEWKCERGELVEKLAARDTELRGHDEALHARDRGTRDLAARSRDEWARERDGLVAATDAARRDRDLAEKARKESHVDVGQLRDKLKLVELERSKGDAELRDKLRLVELERSQGNAEKLALQVQVGEHSGRIVDPPKDNVTPAVVARTVVVPAHTPLEHARRAESSRQLARAAVLPDRNSRPAESSSQQGEVLIMPQEMTAGKTASVAIPQSVADTLGLDALLKKRKLDEQMRDGKRTRNGPSELEYVPVEMLLHSTESIHAQFSVGEEAPKNDGTAVAICEAGGWVIKFQAKEQEGPFAMDVRAYGEHTLTLATSEGHVITEAVVFLMPPERIRPSRRYEFFDALNNERIQQMSYAITDSFGRRTRIDGVREIALVLDDVLTLPDGVTLVEVFGVDFETASLRFLKFGNCVRSEATDSVFFNQIGSLLRGQLRIVLSWSDRPKDLDLHCVSSKGGHIYWSNKIAGEMQIDMDVTKGQGPETITLDPKPGRSYRVFVHNYTGSKIENIEKVVDNDLAFSVASIQLFDGSGASPQMWEVPSNPVENRLYWEVFTIYMADDKTIKLVANNELLALRPEKPPAPGKEMKNAGLVAYALHAISNPSNYPLSETIKPSPGPPRYSTPLPP